MMVVELDSILKIQHKAANLAIQIVTNALMELHAISVMMAIILIW